MITSEHIQPRQARSTQEVEKFLQQAQSLDKELPECLRPGNLEQAYEVLCSREKMSDKGLKIETLPSTVDPKLAPHFLGLTIPFFPQLSYPPIVFANQQFQFGGRVLPPAKYFVFPMEAVIREVEKRAPVAAIECRTYFPKWQNSFFIVNPGCGKVLPLSTSK